MKLAALKTHTAARAEDFLRYNAAPRGVMAMAGWALARSIHPADVRWMHHACAAARSSPSRSMMMAIEEWTLQRLERLPEEVLWSWFPPAEDVPAVCKAAVLKPARPGEKGVLFVSFESQWENLARLGPQRLQALAAEYELVVAPTWSPPHMMVNLVFPRLFPGTLHCTISNLRDLEIFPRLNARYRPLPLFASSWVQPELYQPRPRAERDIDLVMVANFGRYKRHHAVFSALAGMPADQRPRITLVGQPHGSRTAQVLENEMAAYGVKDSFILRSRISDAEVVDILCRSRAALITSLREGSCVAVVEAMMADTPLALLKGAEIGSAAFLNEHTGAWLDETKLAQELPAFIRRSHSLSPRRWLLENQVECHSSTRLLNEHLKTHALARGGVWSEDIFPHHWRPDPRYLRPEDEARALAACQDIKSRHGLSLNRL